MPSPVPFNPYAASKNRKILVTSSNDEKKKPAPAIMVSASELERLYLVLAMLISELGCNVQLKLLLVQQRALDTMIFFERCSSRPVSNRDPASAPAAFTALASVAAGCGSGYGSGYG